MQQGTAVTTYTYDARGNQTQQVQTGTGVTTTTNYGYDLANRLISTSISNNAVIPLSTSATYAYNAQGQRVTRVEDEVITHFYYTGSALLFTTVNEYVLQTQNILDPSGTIVASKRFEGQAETEQDPYADDYFFYRYDVRGSVTNIVDGEGAVVKSYDYDEFGVTTSTGDTFFNEVTFTGSVADASGLLYMNARYYNPRHRPLPVAGYLYRFRLRPVDAAPLRLLQQQPRQHGRSDGAYGREAVYRQHQ